MGKIRGRSRGALVSLSLLFSFVSVGLLPVEAVAQEQAWVRSEVRLNVRTGPGVQFRIVNVIKTGDEVAILARNEDWTQIRMVDGNQGWIPEGYLKPEAPPTIRLQQLDVEVVSLREKLEKTTEESSKLRTSNDTLSQTEDAQKSEIDRLSLENTKLRAGARFPEMIAGASILAAGMIIGAMLAKSTGRKSSTRIRF